jgi:hypothetical protein
VGVISRQGFCGGPLGGDEGNPMITTPFCLRRLNMRAIAEKKPKIFMLPNDPKLSHGAKNRKREFAANFRTQEQPPLAPARC